MNSPDHDGDDLRNPGRNLLTHDDGDEDELTSTVNNDRLYTLLNVPKAATATEIRERYRELAVLLHPDKAPADRKAVAEARFNDVKLAYDVLSDPERRAIYDALGEEGLRSEWRLGPRLKTPEEFRAASAKLANAQREALADRIWLPTQTTASCTVDAISLLSNEDNASEALRNRLSNVRIDRTAIVTSWKSSLSPTTTVNWFTRVRGGPRTFQQSFLGTVRHQISPRLSVVATTSFTAPHIWKTSARYKVDKWTFLSVEADSPLAVFAPTFKAGVQRRLYKNGVGSITYHHGSVIRNQSPSFGVTYSKEATRKRPARVPALFTPTCHAYNLNVNSSPQVGGLEVDLFYAIPILRYATVSVGGTIVPGGFFYFLKSELRVAPGLVFSWQTNLGIAGINLQLGITRQGSKLNIPIILAPSGIEWAQPPWWALLLSLVPVGCCYAAEIGWLEPRRRAELRGRLGATVDERKESMIRRKREALEVVELMREQVSRRGEAETRKDGLVIRKAWYGSQDAIEQGESEEIADVRVALQALVRSSQLSIPGGRSKAELVGFWNPCMYDDEEPVLLVEYEFRGRIHRQVVEDDAILLIPRRGDALLSE